MSDNESTNGESPVKADKKAVVFTEKEEMVLKAAWRCLKSGPPEVINRPSQLERTELTRPDRHGKAHEGCWLQHHEDYIQHLG